LRREITKIIGLWTLPCTLDQEKKRHISPAGRLSLRATCERSTRRMAPRHRTQVGISGKRTKRSNKIHGHWTWSKEHQWAVRKMEARCPDALCKVAWRWQLDQSITSSQSIKITQLSMSINQ